MRALKKPITELISEGEDIQFLSNEFFAAKPFPHIAIDDFLPLEMAEAALHDFPLPEDPIWTSHGRLYGNPGNAFKYEMTKYDAMPPALQNVVDYVNSEETIEFLESLTGITDLMADSTLGGGGLNMVPPGGFLRAHSDFNFNNELQAYRTINLLVYMNKNWKPEYNGGLELWDPETHHCIDVIQPTFNRAAIFITTSKTPHGYATIKCPEGMARKSFNFYFYKKEAVKGISEKPHPTLWIR